ncbi:hypothetical protein Rhopal_002940-T1 [Rhodotorula paludigena]|uniref:Uncharacterized protein n=1 Tax=Rhodotorula paludigena TaxID=86838 RepID=A0AAV5GKC6_9BASI|nr:hypothetical protein Rhopal_002940-T1 [Rhodotorula paludigena]
MHLSPHLYAGEAESSQPAEPSESSSSSSSSTNFGTVLPVRPEPPVRPLGWLGTPSPLPSESAEPASSSLSSSASTDFGTFLPPTPEPPIRPLGWLGTPSSGPSEPLAPLPFTDAYGFDCQRREMEEVEAATSHSAPATFRPPAPMDDFAHALADALEPYAEEVEETLEAPKFGYIITVVPDEINAVRWRAWVRSAPVQTYFDADQDAEDAAAQLGALDDDKLVTALEARLRATLAQDSPTPDDVLSRPALDPLLPFGLLNGAHRVAVAPDIWEKLAVEPERRVHWTKVIDPAKYAGLDAVEQQRLVHADNYREVGAKYDLHEIIKGLIPRGKNKLSHEFFVATFSTIETQLSSGDRERLAKIMRALECGEMRAAVYEGMIDSGYLHDVVKNKSRLENMLSGGGIRVRSSSRAPSCQKMERIVLTGTILFGQAFGVRLKAHTHFWALMCKLLDRAAYWDEYSKASLEEKRANARRNVLLGQRLLPKVKVSILPAVGPNNKTNVKEFFIELVQAVQDIEVSPKATASAIEKGTAIQKRDLSQLEHALRDIRTHLESDEGDCLAFMGAAADANLRFASAFNEGEVWPQSKAECDSMKVWVRGHIRAVNAPRRLIRIPGLQWHVPLANDLFSDWPTRWANWKCAVVAPVLYFVASRHIENAAVRKGALDTFWRTLGKGVGGGRPKKGAQSKKDKLPRPDQLAKVWAKGGWYGLCKTMGLAEETIELEATVTSASGATVVDSMKNGSRYEPLWSSALVHPLKKRVCGLPGINCDVSSFDADSERLTVDEHPSFEPSKKASSKTKSDEAANLVAEAFLATDAGTEMVDSFLGMFATPKELNALAPDNDSAHGLRRDIWAGVALIVMKRTNKVRSAVNQTLHPSTRKTVDENDEDEDGEEGGVDDEGELTLDEQAAQEERLDMLDKIRSRFSSPDPHEVVRKAMKRLEAIRKSNAAQAEKTGADTSGPATTGEAEAGGEDDQGAAAGGDNAADGEDGKAPAAGGDNAADGEGVKAPAAGGDNAADGEDGKAPAAGGDNAADGEGVKALEGGTGPAARNEGAAGGTGAPEGAKA